MSRLLLPRLFVASMKPNLICCKRCLPKFGIPAARQMKQVNKGGISSCWVIMSIMSSESK